MTRTITVVVLLAFSQTGVIAEDSPAKLLPKSAEEQELLDLEIALQTKEGTYYKEGEKITDLAQQSSHYALNDPAREFVPKLLAFEERQRGTHLGLMALCQIAGLAASSGELDGARYSGRREALKRLPKYASHIELTHILRLIGSGGFEPQSEQLFRALCESRDAEPIVRDFSKLMFAQWLLGQKHRREYSEQRIRELDKGAEPQFPTERQLVMKYLTVLPGEDQMKAWEKEAMELLRVVTKSDQTFRRPAFQSAGPSNWLFRFDAERTKTMPRLSEMAEGMLFKAIHLQDGKTPENFKVRLVSEKDWALSDQAGKVVIIQFSFKGCGPCEAMYPDLREIQKEHGQKISILSITADEKQSDTVESVKLGDLTWDVYWDGFRGPLATRWAVSYHPTVYVLDSKGAVAGQDLRGKQLKQKVADLVKLIESPKEPRR